MNRRDFQKSALMLAAFTPLAGVPTKAVETGKTGTEKRNAHACRKYLVIDSWSSCHAKT